MSSEQLTLALWSALTFWVLGQIWQVQIVIYPLFAEVGEREYVHYHRFYSRRIRLPVIPLALASFLLPIPLALFGPPVPLWLRAANVAVGLSGLLVTVLLEIPRHARLEKEGKDQTTIEELVRYNWLRTLSISTQAVLALLMLGSVT